MKTAELTGAALDWVVAKCEGWKDWEADDEAFTWAPDGCGWLFVDEDLCRIRPDGRLERVGPCKWRGKMIWRDDTLYIYNGGRVYVRLFANIVRIGNLFKE